MATATKKSAAKVKPEAKTPKKAPPAKKTAAETPPEPILIPPIAPPPAPETPKGQIIRSVRFDKVTKNYYILETQMVGDQIRTRHSERQFETIERTREYIDNAVPLQFTEWFSY